MLRRPVLAVGTVLTCALPLVGAPASPASASPPAQAGSGTATVGVRSDAWYSTSSACTASPTGCLPAAPPTTYPDKTLHVGVTAGQEEARSYLALDLAGLPGTTTVLGGTLRLPVSPEADGTRSAETAQLQACLVTTAFKDDVQGAPDVPPQVDCKKATSPAKYSAAAGPVPAAFTVDLGPFAAAWADGSADHGIALLPAAATSPTDLWHVAFSAHDRKADALMRVTAVVTFSSASATAGESTADQPTTFDNAPAAPLTQDVGTSAVSFGAPPLAPVSTPVLAVPPAPAPAPQVPAAPAAAPQLQPQAFSIPGSGYAYPGVFLLPLVLLGLAGWLARALTRDLTPRP